jgi:hypothetical protein
MPTHQGPHIVLPYRCRRGLQESDYNIWLHIRSPIYSCHTGAGGAYRNLPATYVYTSGGPNIQGIPVQESVSNWGDELSPKTDGKPPPFLSF